MNEYFNQASADKSWILDREGYAYDNSILKYTIDVAIRSFESICAIFGGFEKSDLFGLGNKITFRNGSVAGKDFEQNQLYLQNILPFLKTVDANSETLKPDDRAILKSFTRALYSHPLKALFDSSFSALPNPILEKSEIQHNKKPMVSKKEITNRLYSVVRKFLKDIHPEIQNPTDVISLLARNPEHNPEYFQQLKTTMTKEESETWEKLKTFDHVANNTIVGKFFNLMPKNDA